jgi:hypothetical protein
MKYYGETFKVSPNLHGMLRRVVAIKAADIGEVDVSWDELFRGTATKRPGAYRTIKKKEKK